ncbi:MAG: hypothetical protein GY719_06090 [bacterium]|nr:hypothetical protein [bacterium]
MSLTFRIRLGLRLLGQRLRAVPAWLASLLGLGRTERGDEAPVGYRIRVIGPLGGDLAPESDEKLLGRMRQLAPEAGEGRLRSLLDSLPPDRGARRPAFPHDTYLLATSPWREKECEWLQGANLDREPTLHYLEGRHGGSDETVVEPPPFLLVHGRRESVE